MSTKQELLALLAARKGAYLSGQELAQTLGVSRAAVWKAVKALRQEGHPIDAATNRGYCLRQGGDILSAQGVERYLGAAGEALEITVSPTLPSTNARLRELAAQGAAQGLVVAAGAQTQGRGRWGRPFFSPADTGVYLSLLLRPEAYDPRQASRLTAAAAVAMCQALEEVSGKSAAIKWVNDIYMEGRKVCGILTEGSFSLESGALEYLVLGAGVNLYAPAGGFPEELRDIAGGVLEAPADDGRNRLAGGFLRRFWALYTHPEDRGYIGEYRRRSLVIGRTVTVLRGSESRRAQALDIDDECRLVVAYDDGATQALSYGEVRLLV